MKKEFAHKIMNFISKNAKKSAMQGKGPIGAKPIPASLREEK